MPVVVPRYQFSQIVSTCLDWETIFNRTLNPRQIRSGGWCRPTAVPGKGLLCGIRPANRHQNRPPLPSRLRSLSKRRLNSKPGADFRGGQGKHVMTNGPPKQERWHRTIVTFAVSRSANTNAVPKVVSTGAVGDSNSCLKRSMMNSVLRPEFIPRPDVATPPVFAMREVVVPSKCDTH
jgi:hypothetical protein